MPIYEFYSPKTRKIYSFYARSLSYAGRVPRCPDDPKAAMEKMVSSFAVTGRAAEKPAGGPAEDAADDPRLERAMAEMERDFGGMDEANPDPRQLARMMQKMSDLTGEKMPAPMMEMMARMEKGEDPEKLEEEYGGALDDFTPGGDDAEGGEAGAAGGRRIRRRRIQRDPTLYEMADFLD